MKKAVCDGAEFSCPFCTSKLKLKVFSSPAKKKGKTLANKINCIFPPPAGGMCRVVPSAPMPCTPAAFVIDPGKSGLTIQSFPALSPDCKFQCAKGGQIKMS